MEGISLKKSIAMKNHNAIGQRKAVASWITLVLATANIEMFVHPIIGAAEVPPPSEPPHHVTPWTPMPSAWQRSATPEFAPSLSLSSTRWTDLGPAPLGALNGVSGRITGISAHPTQANVIYVTPAGGGVWKTTNGGASWTPLTDKEKTLSMGAIAMGAKKKEQDNIYTTNNDDQEDNEDRGQGSFMLAPVRQTTRVTPTLVGVF